MNNTLLLGQTQGGLQPQEWNTSYSDQESRLGAGRRRPITETFVGEALSVWLTNLTLSLFPPLPTIVQSNVLL